MGYDLLTENKIFLRVLCYMGTKVRLENAIADWDATNNQLGPINTCNLTGFGLKIRVAGNLLP